MGRLAGEARMTIKVLDERGATGAEIARLLGGLTSHTRAEKQWHPHYCAQREPAYGYDPAGIFDRPFHQSRSRRASAISPTIEPRSCLSVQSG